VLFALAFMSWSLWGWLGLVASVAFLVILTRLSNVLVGGWALIFALAFMSWLLWGWLGLVASVVLWWAFERI